MTPLRFCMFAIFALAARLTAAGEQLPDLASASQPLADGVPQVAVVRLRNFLRGDLTQPEREAATVKLSEALLAAEQPDEALKVLRDANVPDSAELKFLRAQANAALRRWPEALALYQQAASDVRFAFQVDARCGEAESLRALGRIDDALRAFEGLQNDKRRGTLARMRLVELMIEKQDVDGAERMLKRVRPKLLAERKERRFLAGRVELAKGNREGAIDRFKSIVRTPGGAAHSVLIATLLAMADAHLQEKTPAAGDDFLEDFIEHYPTDRDLPVLFAKLDQLYAAGRNQSRHELGRWAHDEAQPRRALSLWYLARAELRMGHRDLAREAFRRLEASRPDLPELAEAFMEHARLELEDSRFDEALAVLAAARLLQPPAPLSERIDLLAGRIEYLAKRSEVAATRFQNLAKTRSGGGSGAALYNASVAWLQAGDAERAAQVAQSVEPSSRGELLLERGLVAASRGGKQAAELLQSFVRDFPQHARVAEGWVALAELAFHAAPPRLEEARAHLARAVERRPAGAAAERADYLAIWIDDAGFGADESKVIAGATQFLQKFPDSALSFDVRLKLAETYFRRQDFASAQTQFEILAQRNPASPEAEKAQFFAAQSAMQSMGAESLDRALLLFDQVVKKNGELKWAARNEQAVIERKLGKPQDAITFYDEVARGDAKPAEKREAICGKADVLYEMGVNDPENYRRAMALYDELAGQKDASAHWRNQALFKKGMCLEKLNVPAEALATFYRIVEDDGRGERQREYFWFYKAGFNAARLLEEDSKWQPAAAIYEKLAFAGGGRSEEAKSRLNRLRLEHFLWDQ